MKKGISIVIIFLLVGMCIIPSTGSIDIKMITLSTPGNTIYVGGSGPNNYTKMQDAIDNASDGDTVFVYGNKTYYENLIVDVSIDLIGEDKNSTTIDGRELGDVIKLTVDGIKVNGFTLKNCKGEPLQHNGAIFTVLTNNHTITNNIICNNKDSGINFEKSHYNIVSGNYIVDNWMHGIYLLRSGNNLISNNIVENSDIIGIGAGIRIQLTSSANNIIVNNYVMDNGRGIVDSGLSNDITDNNIVNNGEGISLAGRLNNIENNYLCDNGKAIYANGVYNNISYNYIENCKGYGMIIDGSHINVTNNEIINNFCYAGVILYGQDKYFANNNVTGSQRGIVVDSKNCMILQNQIINNNDGIIIYGKSNVIKDNIIESNNINGINILGSKEFNVIVGNSICHNNLYGIYCNVSCKNIICYNNISLNNRVGVYLVWNSTNNVINGNNFSDNLQNVNITDFSSFNNTIYHNNFFDCDVKVYDESNNSWDDGNLSGGNYWDDYNGTDADGDGIGDTPYNISGGDNQDGYPLMFPYVKKGAPIRPLIGGIASGKIWKKYNYTFLTTDPDNDEVYYYIDWGDGTHEEWIGPFSSGTSVTKSHKWNFKDTYIIRAKAKDVNGEESDWAYLEVTMPKNKPFNFNVPLISWWLERFPLLNQIVNLVMERWI